MSSNPQSAICNPQSVAPSPLRPAEREGEGGRRPGEVGLSPSSTPAAPAPSSILDPPSSSLPFTPSANESAKAFETFLCYFDIGQNRSFARVAKLTAVNLNTVKQWAHRFDWRERVRAYNTHLLRTRLAVETDARRNSAELRAQRALQFQDAEWKAAEKLLRAAQSVLDLLLQTAPDKLSLSDVARALEIASKLGRLSTGLATEQVAHAGEVKVNLQLEIESAIKKVYGPVVDLSGPSVERESPRADLPAAPSSILDPPSSTSPLRPAEREGEGGRRPGEVGSF